MPELVAKSHSQFMSYYHHLVDTTIKYGKEVNGRNGPVLRSVGFNYLTLSYSDMFLPILTSRKMNPNCWITEFCWDWNGQSNVNELGKYAYLWNTWADSEGELEYSYGRIWRNPLSQSIAKINGVIPRDLHLDQIDRVVKSLVNSVKTNIPTRRACISTWDFTQGTEENDKSVPPCHPFLHFDISHLSGDKAILHLTVTSRSQDLLVGFPGDVIRYNLLLRTIALAVNNKLREDGSDHGVMPHCITFHFHDAHVYKAHIETYETQERPVFIKFLERPFNLQPNIELIDKSQISSTMYLKPEMFKVDGYVPLTDRIAYGLIA